MEEIEKRLAKLEKANGYLLAWILCILGVNVAFFSFFIGMLSTLKAIR